MTQWVRVHTCRGRTPGQSRQHNETLSQKKKVMVSTLLLKHHDLCNLEKKEFISSYGFQSIIQGIQGRNLEVETDAEAMLTGLVLMACYACFQILSKAICPSHNGLGGSSAFLNPSLNKKMPYRLAHKQVLQRHCLGCGSLFPVNSDSFINITKKQNRKGKASTTKPDRLSLMPGSHMVYINYFHIAVIKNTMKATQRRRSYLAYGSRE